MIKIKFMKYTLNIWKYHKIDLWIRQTNYGFIQHIWRIVIVSHLQLFKLVARICCYVMALAVVAVVEGVAFQLKFAHRRSHTTNSIWNLVQLAMGDSPIGQQLSNSFRFPFRGYLHRISANYYNRCCHASSLAMVAVLYHLLMWLSLLLLNSMEWYGQFNEEEKTSN